MGLKNLVQHWFQKRSSVITAAQATTEMMMRFNALVRSDPKDIIEAIDSFNMGYLDPLARLVADYEQRDDKMRVASMKLAATVARCGWTVRPKKGFEDDPAAAYQVEVLERFWSSIRVTSAFKRNESGGLSLLEEQMMSAQSYGFTCHDLSWRPLANGELEATFTHVPLWHFENHTGELRYLPSVGAWDGVEMKRGEWMVSTGDGIGIAASICACMKRLGLTNWLLFTDRCVLPLMVGKTGAAYKSEQWENLKKAMNNINRLARIVVDQTTDISAIQMDGGKQNPFGPLVDWADRAIVTLYRGGDLATISRSDAVGGMAQADEVDALEQRSCRRITETLNEQVSRFVIDYVFGQKLLAEIAVEPVSKPNLEQDMAVDEHLIGLGVKLSKTDALSRYGRAEAESDDDALVVPQNGPQAPETAPRGAFPNETPFKTANMAFKNARSDSDGSMHPPERQTPQIAKNRPVSESDILTAFADQNGAAAEAVKAVLADPSPSAFATLMERLPSLLPEDPALAAVIADAMAEKFGERLTQRRGEAEVAEALANMREYKRERDGKFAEVDHPRDFKPGDNPDSSETQAAEIGKGKKAIERCLAEKVDVPNAVSRGDVGLISLRYGDEKSGLAHFKDRADALQHLSETLVKGKAGAPYQQGQKLNIEHAGYVAALALTNSPEHSDYPKNWVLTSFGPKDKKAKGVN